MENGRIVSECASFGVKESPAKILIRLHVLRIEFVVWNFKVSRVQNYSILNQWYNWRLRLKVLERKHAFLNFSETKILRRILNQSLLFSLRVPQMVFSGYTCTINYYYYIDQINNCYWDNMASNRAQISRENVSIVLCIHFKQLIQIITNTSWYLDRQRCVSLKYRD